MSSLVVKVAWSQGSRGVSAGLAKLVSLVHMSVRERVVWILSRIMGMRSGCVSAKLRLQELFSIYWGRLQPFPVTFVNVLFALPSNQGLTFLNLITVLNFIQKRGFGGWCTYPPILHMLDRLPWDNNIHKIIFSYSIQCGKKYCIVFINVLRQHT